MIELSKSESLVSRLVHELASGREVGDDVTGAETQPKLEVGLCFFLPECLRQKYPEWKWESLDAVCLTFIRVTGASELEFAGNCILIGDQTLTAVHVKIRSPDPVQGIDWIDCRLGEIDEQSGEVIRDPYGSQAALKRRLSVEDRLDDIHWMYQCVLEQQ